MSVLQCTINGNTVLAEIKVGTQPFLYRVGSPLFTGQMLWAFSSCIAGSYQAFASKKIAVTGKKYHCFICTCKADPRASVH